MPDSFMITNVRAFDDDKIFPATIVIVKHGILTQVGGDAPKHFEGTVIDANDSVLLPGLIDAHVHLHGLENLRQLAKYGVTSACDMNTFPESLVISLRELASKGGVTDFKSPGTLACAPSSMQCRMAGFPSDEAISDISEVQKYIQRRLNQGVDYIKVIADVPGFGQATLNALHAHAKANNKQTIAHAAQVPAFARALEAGFEILTHVPLEATLPSSLITQMQSQHTVVIPTLTMMSRITFPGTSYRHASDSVTALHKAGITILAGTDANAAPGAPASVEHGNSMHGELGLLVDAGLSNLEALRAGTSGPARVFGWGDRGRIEVGRRADLVLVRGDPLVDINNTKEIERVWIKGVEVNLS